jgi:hypothetical protein
VPSAASNPLLAAFAAERQLLEQMRDDVQAKLASFKVSVLPIATLLPGACRA